ncbi:uncharacterized protein LOC116847970 [Odontomachus brunneus]|uniref:uncharacterized protein LOC116847970 n=1 Tax=Odontomachus brunneus TaxID=486640 RepID=UPI0013F27427|nr:uncharacterized protein LOC116847970 [Odontomachus brunneus]
MRVKYATQVLNGTVASCIEMLTRHKCVVDLKDSTQMKIDAEEGIATSEIVLFFNDLFDSVNSSGVSENKLRSPVTEDSAHHAFWTDAKHELRNNGFQKLWKILNLKHGFTFLRTRYCDQDAIENFFGQIRSHAICNNNPTSRQFQDSFITLLMSNMKSVSIIGGNCETSEDPFMLFILEKCLEEDLANEEMYNICRNNDDDDDEQHEMFSDKIAPKQSSVAFLDEKLNEIIVATLIEISY